MMSTDVRDSIYCTDDTAARVHTFIMNVMWGRSPSAMGSVPAACLPSAQMSTIAAYLHKEVSAWILETRAHGQAEWTHLADFV